MSKSPGTETVKCPHCWHPAHGVAVPFESGLSCIPERAMIKSSDPNRCKAVIYGGRDCNCDGKRQWFSSPVLSQDKALEWSRHAEAAGYTPYIFNASDITVNVVNLEGHYLDGCVACVFSETPSPVASLVEFEDRCAMPEELRHHRVPLITS